MNLLPVFCFFFSGVQHMVKHVQMTYYIWLIYDFVMFSVLHTSFAVGQFIY